MTTLTMLVLIWFHFLGDFIAQSDQMAKAKSRSWAMLLAHCAIYSFAFALMGLAFGFVVFVAHLATDAITSRWTSRLWAQGKIHWFYVVFGLDQAIHLTVLVLAWPLSTFASVV